MSQGNTVLRDQILELSRSGSWYPACREWYIAGMEDLGPNNADGTCLCRHVGLRYLFTIKNPITRATLWPIGSKCIDLVDPVLGRDARRWVRQYKEELKQEETRRQTMADLEVLQAQVSASGYLDLCTPGLTPAVLLWLFDHGAVAPSKYNRFDIDRDYFFLVDALADVSNAGSVDVLSPGTRARVNALIGFQIKPFLQRRRREQLERIAHLERENARLRETIAS